MKSLLSPFFLSLSLGIISWFLIYIVFPIEPVFPLSNKALLYILSSYFFLILGYLVFSMPKSTQLNKSTVINFTTIRAVVFVVIASFLLRYFDLFVLRGVSFFNSIKENRMLLDANPSGSIFILASVTRFLFFVPILLLFYSKIKSNKLLFFCILLFLLPFGEGILRGSRNSFFYPSILLVFSLLYFNKIKLKKLHVGIILVISVALFIVATGILKNREMIKEEDYKNLTSTSIYNEFLKPKEFALRKIHNVENVRVKQLLISGLQTGQYYTHGVFEFDNLLKSYDKEEYLSFQYGKYNFYTYLKLSNKIGITNLDLIEIQHANPRKYSFITFFGGLYIDFGWVGLLIMFFLGIFQKFLYCKVQNKRIEFLPLFIFFLFMNFFMLTFNFLRGFGVSIITINLVFIFAIYWKEKEFLKKIFTR